MDECGFESNVVLIVDRYKDGKTLTGFTSGKPCRGGNRLQPIAGSATCYSNCA